jgi:hypothetical protein
VALVYMPLIDRTNRRVLLAWSSALQLAAFVPFIFFDARPRRDAGRFRRDVQRVGAGSAG